MLFGLSHFAEIPFATAARPQFIIDTWTNICSQGSAWVDSVAQDSSWADQPLVANQFISVTPETTSWGDQSVQSTIWDNQDKARLPVRPCVRR